MSELLKELCLAFGPSGCEDSVREIIENYLDKNMPNNAEMSRDVNGNLYVHIKNEGAPKLMVNAHLDEVGFMVTSIEENGLLRFDCVGGIDPIVLSAKRVVMESGLKGAIIVKPIHLISPNDRDKKPQISDMLIDIGANSREEAEKLTFIGEYITFDSDYIEYGEGFIKSKALDDRLGCEIMCKMIKAFKDEGLKSKYDLYFAFTCREEVSFSGAIGASRLINPDYGLVIESKAVADVSGVSEGDKVAILGEGAVVSFADRGTIYDRDFVDKIMDLCKKKDIKYQVHRIVSGGNDSRNLQTMASGCRVALLSASSRYIHSSANVVHSKDLDAIYLALREIILEGEDK